MNNSVNAYYSLGLIDGLGRPCENSAMEYSPKPPQFFRAWRKHNEMSQQELADAIGMSQAQISKIENGSEPYNQRVLEAMAEIFACRPADLLMRAPTDSEEILSIWAEIPEESKATARDVVNAFIPKPPHRK